MKVQLFAFSLCQHSKSVGIEDQNPRSLADFKSILLDLFFIFENTI